MTADKQVTKCCNYMDMSSNFDCLQIPDLQTTKGKLLNFGANGVCGMAGIGTKSEVIDATKQKTLCCKFQRF